MIRVSRFLNSGPARLVTVLLLAQAALLYSSIRPEAIPVGRQLMDFPREVGSWALEREGVVDLETQAILKADDLLTRLYVDRAGNRAADLYIATFRSQRNGKSPHSPKNCLPGNGWTPLESNEITIDVGAAAPIPVNRWVITHGESRSLVFYWYQSRDRAVADEFKAKFWVIADAIRYNRTDTALIRVIVPVVDHNTERANSTAVDFVKAFYQSVREFLPA